MTSSSPNLDLININSYPKFGQNASVYSQDIQRKRNSDLNIGPYLCYKFAEIDV